MLKDEGKLKSIEISNCHIQDLEAILDGTKHKPVINQVFQIHFNNLLLFKLLFQIEYHSYALIHLKPILVLQKHHSIITESYGGLTPFLQHPH